MLPCAGSRSINDRLEPDQNDLTSRERFLFQFVAHKDILVCLPGSINPCHPNYSHPSTICQNIVVVTLEATWQDAPGKSPCPPKPTNSRTTHNLYSVAILPLTGLHPPTCVHHRGSAIIITSTRQIRPPWSDKRSICVCLSAPFMSI